MSSTPPSQSTHFSACQEIADFYQALGVVSRKTEGMFGGKSYTWFVNQDDLLFQICCKSDVSTLGYGTIRVESRMASNFATARYFTVTPKIDSNGIFEASGPFGMERHVIRLPVPNGRISTK
jgi:hypothetical protein